MFPTDGTSTTVPSFPAAKIGVPTTNGLSEISASSGAAAGVTTVNGRFNLDLTRVQQGAISRDERFGYVELATFGFKTPCLTYDPEALKNSDLPHFINVSRYGGVSIVTFAIEMAFNLDSSKSEEWKRLRIANFE